MVAAELAEVDSTENAVKGAAPGKCIVAKSVGLGGGVTTTEMYQAPGLVSRPAKGARHVLVPVGSGRRYVVSIACKNYSVDVSVGEGETEIFSTSADGKTVKAEILLSADGRVTIKNATASLKSILADQNSALSTFATAAGAATSAGQIAAAALTLATALAITTASIAAFFKD